MIIVFIFGLGLSVGSFLNVLVYRLPSRSGLGSLKRPDLGSTISGRSKCPNCRHVLAWYDLVPVLSYLLLWGRCRYCRKKISFRYVLVELLSAFSLLALFFVNKPADFWGWTSLVFRFGTVSLLIVVFFIDLDFLIILDKILVVLAAISIFSVIQGESLDNMLAGFFAGSFFFIVYLVTKGKAIGLGDVKFVFVLGLLLGFPGILIVIYASLIAGTVYGLTLVLFFGVKMRSKIPFGSVLSAVAIIFIIFGKFFTPVFLPYILRLYL